MKSAILNPELFVLPDGKDRFILYAPLEGNAVEVNPDTLLLLQRLNSGQKVDLENPLVKKLETLKIIVDQESYVRDEKKVKEGYLPTHITIMPTFNCNLRCVYCYSRGGENPADLEFKVAKGAIDFLLKSVGGTDLKKTSLGFHGGGEPFLEENMNLVKGCVDYFKVEAEKRGIEPRIVAATNGVMSRKTLEWVCSNFDFLNISLDGPPAIQNTQRPHKDGGHSFPYVKTTIDFLEESNIHYGIRSTITSDSATKMPEILTFFSEITSIKSFQFEPLYEYGRCKTTKTKAPDSDTFTNYFLKAIEIAKTKGLQLTYSGSKIGNPAQVFCGAPKDNFFLTPQGKVTACLEVSRENDPGAEIFQIGSYDPSTKDFVFDQEKINHLKNRRISNLPHCTDCFAKYSCSGDCLAKCYSDSKDIYDTSNNIRCGTNRKLLKTQISNTLKSANKNG